MPSIIALNCSFRNTILHLHIRHQPEPLPSPIQTWPTSNPTDPPLCCILEFGTPARCCAHTAVTVQGKEGPNDAEKEELGPQASVWFNGADDFHNLREGHLLICPSGPFNLKLNVVHGGLLYIEVLHAEPVGAHYHKDWREEVLVRYHCAETIVPDRLWEAATLSACMVPPKIRKKWEVETMAELSEQLPEMQAQDPQSYLCNGVHCQSLAQQPRKASTRSRRDKGSRFRDRTIESTDCEAHNCIMVGCNYECGASCKWRGGPCSNSRGVRQMQIKNNSKKTRVRKDPMIPWQLRLETYPGSFIRKDQLVGIYTGRVRDTLGGKGAFTFGRRNGLPELKSSYIMNIPDKEHRYSVDGAMDGNHTAYIQSGETDKASNCRFVKGVTCEGLYVVMVRTKEDVGHQTLPVGLTCNYDFFKKKDCPSLDSAQGMANKTTAKSESLWSIDPKSSCHINGIDIIS